MKRHSDIMVTLQPVGLRAAVQNAWDAKLRATVSARCWNHSLGERKQHRVMARRCSRQPNNPIKCMQLGEKCCLLAGLKLFEGCNSHWLAGNGACSTGASYYVP
jgi:hypothetical protein